MSVLGSTLQRRRVAILGSTGSIGTQALLAIEHLNALAERGESSLHFEVVGLAAHSSGALLAEQAARCGAALVALSEREAPIEGPVRALRGPDAAERLVRETRPDLVLAAMVGAAGLPATLAAVELGINVALANKETLAAAGQVVVPAARRTGAHLLPIDSEHSGLWQCLQGLCGSGERVVPPCRAGPGVRRAILTASGGPFRTMPVEEMRDATPEQALAHPTWSMGPKNTIDSATMVNKGLELIEAHWLFGLEAERLGVLIHPQSVVHAIIELADGSSLAQLSAPDMRCPIQLALTWPARALGCARRLDWREVGRLDFAEPDHARFPAVELALEVIRRGGAAGAVFNAANEVAVAAFRERTIPFGRVVEVVRETVEGVPTGAADSLEAVLRADAEARRFARSRL